MAYILLLATLCIVLIIFFIYSNLFYFLYLKVPMLSAKKEVLDKITKNIDFKNAKVFYDIGAGNGRVVSYIANKFPGLQCTGIELNISAFCLAKIRNLFSKNKATYIFKDFFKADLKDADIVFAYLFPSIMGRVEEKLEHDLKKGAVAIVSTFPLKNKKPKTILQGEAGKLNTIYIYEY